MTWSNTAQVADPEQTSWCVCKDTAQTWVSDGCGEPRAAMQAGRPTPVKHPVLRLWAINVSAALLQITQKHGNKAAVVSQARIRHNGEAINTTETENWTQCRSQGLCL